MSFSTGEIIVLAKVYRVQGGKSLLRQSLLRQPLQRLDTVLAQDSVQYTVKCISSVALVCGCPNIYEVLTSPPVKTKHVLVFLKWCHFNTGK